MGNRRADGGKLDQLINLVGAGNSDAGRTDELGNKEFIVETTGGPKKYFRHRRRKNPFFTPPKPITEPKIKEMWYKEFVEALRRLRQSNKITQKQLGKLIGTYQAVVSRFETGQTNPSLAFMIKYAQALGWEIEIKIKEKG